MAHRDEPWLMRTYAGHTDPRAANALFRTNLSKGQTGLSVAFDLPTQTGYDADDPMAAGEVGKVGVPIGHIADMDALFAGIPLAKTNTSMTINATAAWLLALYIAAAERQGANPRELRGTTQNDILKEYLSRGTHIFPPEPSLRLTADTIEYTVVNIPKWNPVNICSYHLQEAGATPVQELAFALVNAFAVLDRVQKRPGVSMSDVVGQISFFVNAGIRFIEEMCKLKAFVRLWDRYMAERYGVADAKKRRFRYGVQVNSLGLTAQQPENNVQRILLEMLAVTLSKEARARSVQLPAWNEALGLPRPWDQQWALRMQQVLAYETDVLEYEDLFEGSNVIEAKVSELMASADAELTRVLRVGDAAEAIEVMKRALVASHAARQRQIESGELSVVGVNTFTEHEPSLLVAAEVESVLVVDPEAERKQIERLCAFRAERNAADVSAALRGLEDAARSGSNVMPASIRAAHAGVTTGEWAGTLRKVFGEYRAPTGLQGLAFSGAGDSLEAVRQRVKQVAAAIGHPLRLLVAKPGLDGHSNGAEQVAVRAKEAGFEVIYDGIRLTPEQIAESALQEDVDAVGISIHSGSHMTLVPRVVELLRAKGLGDVPVFVGGVIPESDQPKLRSAGVARVYTPGQATLTVIVGDIAEMIAERRRAA
ncbi:MAG: protein meaA [Deltaproteobacteria bacterium]|nr:protein meaA [Deltaproteobacteria bacterium]MBI3389988.1 protein meaA [Deltaproteobacteria bacterium]